MNETIDVTKLDEHILNILGEYDKHTQEVLHKEAVKCGNWASRRLRSTSPRDSGEYANDWTSKRTSKRAKGVNSGGAIVFNRTHYQLTHLLEEGHVSKNKYGITKRKTVPAYPHIAKVEKAVAEKYMRGVLSKL